MNHSSFVSVSKAHIGTGPHRALEPGTIGRVPDDVILRRCDAQEVQVIRARGAGPRLRRVIQHPNVILTQEGILCRNKQKKNPTAQVRVARDCQSTDTCQGAITVS